MPEKGIPAFLRLDSALQDFLRATSTQDQEHIRPFHKYVALRLVIEGGFCPDEVIPHPPLKIESRGSGRYLCFDKAVEDDKECTVLGGLKSKRVDVVVSKSGVGPVVAVSVKGTGNAFRNLTNRMEEAIGDSTNVHIMYPGLVYGFLHLLKANRAGEPGIHSNDVSVGATGKVVGAIQRYHDVLLGLAGRRYVRNDFTRYEAVALAMVESSENGRAILLQGFPANDSPLRLNSFFATLYTTYDLRFPFVSPSVRILRRLGWDPKSSFFARCGPLDDFDRDIGFSPRLDSDEGVESSVTEE